MERTKPRPPESGSYWENVLATHNPASRPFSKTANLFTWSLILAYVLVQRIELRSTNLVLWYWSMMLTALLIALVHEKMSGQTILNLEGARLKDAVPQLIVASVAFGLIYFSPILLFGRRPVPPGFDDALLLILASLGESIWFVYVMPQIVPYSIFVVSFAFAVSHEVFISAFLNGTINGFVISFVIVAFLFNLSMILILASRTWLRGVSRFNLWRGGGLWVVVVIHLAVNLAIRSYGWLYGVAL